MSKERAVYDRLYASQTEGEFRYGNGRPDGVVTRFAEILPVQAGTVLDLGAGDGRHAIFLAKRGFRVQAIDSSLVGIQHLEEEATRNGLAIDTSIEDLAVWVPETMYAGCIATFVFQHLSKEQLFELIHMTQDATVAGGVHAFAWFVKEGDFSLISPNLPCWYPDSGEIEQLYAGWETIFIDERWAAVRNKRADGTPGQTKVIRLIARKV